MRRLLRDPEAQRLSTTDGEPAAFPGPTASPRTASVLDAYLDDVFAAQHLTDRRLSVEELFPANLPAALR